MSNAINNIHGMFLTECFCRKIARTETARDRRKRLESSSSMRCIECNNTGRVYTPISDFVYPGD